MKSYKRAPWLGLIVVGLLIALMVGCAQSRPKTDNQDGVITPVEISSFTLRITTDGFIPSTIHVHKGDRVQLTFVTEDPNGEPHPTNLIGYGIVGPLNAQTPRQTIEFTADKSGSFGFFCVNDNCIIHSVLLNGKLIVQ